MEVHGQDIQPFGFNDRVDFLVAMDDAIVHINLSNIELLAVEEFLPAAGPSAESLLNLYGTNGIIGKQSPKPQAVTPSGTVAAAELAEHAAGPQPSQATRASGRKLLQLLPRSSSGPRNAPYSSNSISTAFCHDWRLSFMPQSQQCLLGLVRVLCIA